MTAYGYLNKENLMEFKLKFTGSLLLTGMLLSGCVNQENQYCHDDSYTVSMYYYLRDEPDFLEQQKLMTDYFAKAEESGKKVAPGAYAHYAMLMSKSGNEGEALKYLEMEKSAYPDSAHYIDFLLTHARQIKKAGSKGAEKKTAVQTDDSQQIKEYRQ
jgi:hypothetical protein